MLTAWYSPSQPASHVPGTWYVVQCLGFFGAKTALAEMVLLAEMVMLPDTVILTICCNAGSAFAASCAPCTRSLWESVCCQYCIAKLPCVQTPSSQNRSSFDGQRSPNAGAVCPSQHCILLWADEGQGRQCDGADHGKDAAGFAVFPGKQRVSLLCPCAFACCAATYILIVFQ